MSDPNPPAAGAPAAGASPDAEEISAAELKEAEQYLGKDNFLKMHKPQFMAMKLPPNLASAVYGKLLSHSFDALESFQVEYVEDEGFRLVCTKEGGLRAGQDVWLLDHLWTTSVGKGLQQLTEIDGLVERLWTLADMDRRIQEEREEKAAAAAAAKPAAAAAAAPAASPAAAGAGAESDASASLEEPDEHVLSALMSEASVSRDRAIEAYRANKGDLIASVVWCGGVSEREQQMQSTVEKMVEQQQQQQAAAAGADDSDAAVEPFDSSSLSLDEKAALLWPWLFRAGLVGSYFTTVQNEVSASSLRNEDVNCALFVNDEVGSSVAQANDANNANAQMAPLVCVTLGGVAFSLLWLTSDVKEGEEILITRRPPIRLAGVPSTA